MRRGSVFRRCTKKDCRTRVDAGVRRCPGCGADGFTWWYIVDLAGPGESRRQRKAGGFPTKAAAVDAVTRLQAASADGTYVEPSRVTLGEYLRQWWEAGSWRGNTRRDYRVAIERHIGPRLGRIALQALTKPQVKALYQHLLSEGKIVHSGRGGEPVSGEPLSKKSVQNVHICLRAALNDAVEDGLLRSNPAVGAFSYSKTKDRQEMLTWSVEELQAFLAFTAGDREHILYRTALATGMRRGELLGLRRRDLDLLTGRLRVRQQWTRNGDGGLRFLPLKTGIRAWRNVDLDELTVGALEVHLQAQEFERRSWGSAYRTDLDLVFAQTDGRPNDPDVVRRRFERRARDAGILPIRFHDLRHTHATLLLEAGQSIKYVAERLGDREDTVLETYGHVTSRMRSSGVAQVARFLNGPPQVVRDPPVTPRAESGGLGSD
ncbi:MAG: hypothetical protein DLM67_14785 [Candidatus Nephthysia bennettiae]|nr:MAG: hypothetical protein DLM67_14785 [Candidatus Dormibacteraeota bacterium]